MRRVLLVTYHFPPDLAVGAIRPAAFSKYLSDAGWEVTVLTVKDKYHNRREKSSLDSRYTGALVTRTCMFRSPSYYYRKLKGIVRRDKGESHVGAPSRGRPRTKGQNQLRQWISALLSFPDEHVGWFPFAVVKGIQLARRKNIEIVMTSGPPHSVHMIGACLGKLARIPWIADFRDAFLDDYYPQGPADRGELCLGLALRLEAWFMSRSAFILTTTERFSVSLQTRYPIHKEKVFTLPNGYDPEDFVGISREKEKDFTISYLGTFYGPRNPKPMLCAVSELIQQKRLDPSRVVVRFIGHCNEAVGTTVEAMISDYGLGNNVQILPWLPRRQALEIMVRSHVLLLLAEDQPLEIPGKVYEYLAAGSDILAITSDGATADLLRETGIGVVISPDDHLELKMRVEALYQKYLTTNERNNKNSLIGTTSRIKYNRRHLTQELAHFLEQASHQCAKNQQ